MMKNLLWKSRVILLFIFVTGTYQTPILENSTSVSTSQENKCYTVNNATELCNSYVEENDSSDKRINDTDSGEFSLDLNEIWNKINDAKKNKELSAETDEMYEMEVPTSNWRVGSLESQNQHFLNSEQYSDITFEVGPDNNTEITYAHKLLLARGSPVFEAIFNATSTSSKKIRYRIRDIDISVFETLVQFIYTEKLCFKSFDEACEMLSIATRFQMPELAEYCHYHIWLHMYPKNLWSAYHCAVNANDTTMASAAMDMIIQKTELAVMDPAFSTISESTFIALLRHDSLNVSSELVLYQGALRWAMAEATRRGLPQDPESLRECLSNALQYIRFLTLTPSEFANIQYYTSQILSCSESLSVLSNLNVPGVMPLPSKLSSNINTRKLPATFKIYEKPSYTPTCMGNQLDLVTSENIFDTITSVFRGDEAHDVIKSIKIPKPFNIDCSQNEVVTIAVIDLLTNTVIHNAKYTVNPCYNNRSSVHNIQLIGDVKIPRRSDRLFKIKVILYNSGVYPLSLGTGPVEKSGSSWSDKYKTKLGVNNFVYSIANYYDINDEN